MSHTLIVGMTESGKTTLAKSLAASYRAHGIKVIVCDAAHNSWPCDFQTGSLSEFVKVAAGARNCALFIDEAGDYLNASNAASNEIATKYRHLGHFAHFIGQRPPMISPTIRHNCSRLILFRVSRYDAVELEKEWDKPEILEAPTQLAGKYMIISRFSDVQKGAIF